MFLSDTVFLIRAQLPQVYDLALHKNMVFLSGDRRMMTEKAEF